MRARWFGGAFASFWAGLAGAAIVVTVASCGGGASTAGGSNSAYLSAVHVAAPDIGTYRSDVALSRLGHAACDGFRSGATYEVLADRLALEEGSHALPSEDLGAVIDAAVTSFCPQFSSRVG